MIRKQFTEKFGDHLYRLLPGFWRDLDHSARSVQLELSSSSGAISEVEVLKFHHRFMRVFGDAYDELIIDVVRAVLQWLDPLLAPEDVLPHKSSTVGWPMDPGVPTSLQRQIVRRVYSLVYMGRGDLERIRLAILAFTGLQVTVWAPNTDPRRCVLCASLGNSSEVVSGGGSGADPGVVSQSVVVLSPAGQRVDVQVGDRVIVQHGGNMVVGRVVSVSGGQIDLDLEVNELLPEGAAAIHAPPAFMAGLSGTPLGLGCCRLGYTAAPNCVRLGHDSPNNMLSGSARLAWLSRGPAVSDEDRDRRFRFWITAPAKEEDVAAWQKKMLVLLADYMKPARVHYTLQYEDLGITDAKFRVDSSALSGGAKLGG
jgi:phage tail-like protein